MASSSLGGSRPIDPLNYQDVHGLGGTAEGRRPTNEIDMADNTDDNAPPLRRTRFEDRSNIPLVRDRLGEQLQDQFQNFLEK
jgi:hypothetical protein